MFSTTTFVRSRSIINRLAIQYKAVQALLCVLVLPPSFGEQKKFSNAFHETHRNVLYSVGP